MRTEVPTEMPTGTPTVGKRPRRRLARAVHSAPRVLAGVLLAPVAPALAAPPEILVSTDGHSYLPAASVDLFDDLDLIVPGDTMDAQLWVRNNSSTAALVRVAVTDLVVPSPAFGSAVTLSSTINGASFVSPLGGLSNCQVVVQAQTVAAGATMRVDFEVSMDSATSGTTAQGQTAELAFLATAHDVAAGPFPGANGCSSAATGPASGGTGSPLAFTGGSAVLPTAFVALGFLLLGFLFSIARRRRRADERVDEGWS
jgi:hypothetical protein